jgi:hypothetical protein
MNFSLEIQYQKSGEFKLRLFKVNYSGYFYLLADYELYFGLNESKYGHKYSWWIA